MCHKQLLNIADAIRANEATSKAMFIRSMWLCREFQADRTPGMFGPHTFLDAQFH